MIWWYIFISIINVVQEAVHTVIVCFTDGFFELMTGTYRLYLYFFKCEENVPYKYMYCKTFLICDINNFLRNFRQAEGATFKNNSTLV